MRFEKEKKDEEREREMYISSGWSERDKQRMR